MGQNYPLEAPKMYFKTKIFHPNIHWETGEIWYKLFYELKLFEYSVDVIKDEWTPSWTLESLCRALLNLMS